ncbi:MAG: phosphoribosyltransferase family protein, partial [Nitriliruptoraceae bacterium]
MVFADRSEAGRQLGTHLAGYRTSDTVVVGLARGGVAVAAPVADALGAPLDALVVRKIAHPNQPELAIGAIAEGGAAVRAEDLPARFGVDADAFAAAKHRAQTELDDRVTRVRLAHPPVAVAGRTVVLVDDGIATGATAQAAVAAMRRRAAARVVLAVPVAARD